VRIWGCQGLQLAVWILRPCNAPWGGGGGEVGAHGTSGARQHGMSTTIFALAYASPAIGRPSSICARCERKWRVRRFATRFAQRLND
jgi:hypothetical protein